MTSKSKRLSSIALVFVVGLAMLAGPALAAAPTVDTETTDTSTTSDWTDGTNVTGFDANSSNTSYIEANFDSNNTSIQIIDPDTGEIHAENTSDNMELTNASNNYYAWNMSHDELATVPMDAGENKSITVKFINDTSMDNPDTTEITVYLENTDDRAVVYAGDSAAAGDIADVEADTTDEDGILASVPGFSADKETTIEADNVGLGSNASGTTVTVIAANQSDEDTFGAASEKRFGSYSEGDFMSSHIVEIEGHTQAVFNSNAPDDVADDYTYAETTEVNGHDAYQIHVDDDYEGESNVDVMATANGDYGFGLGEFSTKRDAFGGSIAALTAGAFLVISLRRREA